jgi:hypothetical protein
MDIGGIPRAIFSIQQRASGDLTVVIRHGAFYTNGKTFQPNPADAVVEQRLSIHRSTQSKSDINSIVYTKRFRDGRKRRTLNYTSALKRDNSFSLLFSQRCQDLRAAIFDMKKSSEKPVSLGSYNPQFFQLIFSIYAGRKERNFTTASEPDLRFLQVPIGLFNIVVVWSFVSLPSNITGNYAAFRTYKPEEIEVMTDPGLKAFLRMASGGFDEEISLIFFRDKRQRLLEMYFDSINNDFPHMRQVVLPAMRSIASFFAEGDINNPDYKAHFARLRQTFTTEQIAHLSQQITRNARPDTA